ncbi:hypothetical protein CAOG_00130 [Capsaspora owczarzaki ATCC 30864]|nr:hypothetical protein CAOG_00130 [Capsaspora owczarzaki ATCC 30864]|eukprot:XP_004365001.1 hypothetical protein CAOG_00130 [Capsaspora owczarzaki ATCC 30864]
MVRTLADIIDNNVVLKATLKLPPDSEMRQWPVVDVALIDWAVMQQALLDELQKEPSATSKRLAAIALLQRLLEQEMGGLSTGPQIREPKTRFKGVVNGVLSLKDGSVQSAASSEGRSTQVFAPIDKLLGHLEDRLGNLARLEIVTLDLSGNDLRNSDMPYIVKLVQALKCPVIKLRSNRLGMGIPTKEENTPVHYLASLAAEEFVRFVDIVGNYVAAVDWAPAYQQYANETTWNKLVYIPLSWLEDHKWSEPDICGQYVESAKNCHKKFYWANLSDPVFTRHDSLN